MAIKQERDIEKEYSKADFVAKLRRLADCLELGRRFRIRVAGVSLSVPAGAVISVEHERGGSEEELEFQLTWPVTGRSPRRRGGLSKTHAVGRTR